MPLRRRNGRPPNPSSHYTDPENARKVAKKHQPDAERRMVRACSAELQETPAGLRCKTPGQRSKRPPRGSLRGLTGTQRSTLAARLARELDAAPGRIRAALDAALDGGRPATSPAADTATPDEARAIMQDEAQVVTQ